MKTISDIIREEIETVIDNVYFNIEKDQMNSASWSEMYRIFMLNSINNNQIGRIVVELNHEKKFAKIWRSFINDAYRNKGYGKKLYLKTKEFANKYGYDLYGDEVQSQDALNVWNSFKKSGIAKTDDNNQLYIEETDDNINILRLAQKIANNLTTDLRFKKGTVLTNVDVQLSDEAFKRAEGFYIGKDDKGIGNRKERVMEYIKSGELKYAPEPSIYLTPDNKPRLSFGDGRHRFAVLRDLGVKTINISIWTGSKKLIPLLQR